MCRIPTPWPGPLAHVGPPRRRWVNWSAPQGFAANKLKLSPDGVALLKSVETLALEPYDDQTGMKITQWVQGATIGYGHLVSAAEWPGVKDGITAEAADALFRQDLAPFETCVGEVITARLQQYQFDALVILAFNIGAAAFRNSSVARLVNDPDAVTAYTTLEDAWMAWNKSQGKVMKGLENRRRCEWKIYTSARYERW